jgi:hypothetical protein
MTAQVFANLGQIVAEFYKRGALSTRLERHSSGAGKQNGIGRKRRNGGQNASLSAARPERVAPLFCFLRHFIRHYDDLIGET